jgi:tartrate dehydratase beta subunit/fumarate hydratase class I family protein
MTVSLQADRILLSGKCGVEEAESLLNCLEHGRDLPVDITAATAIHTALWQAIMLYRSQIVGPGASSFVTEKLVPALASESDKTVTG